MCVCVFGGAVGGCGWACVKEEGTGGTGGRRDVVWCGGERRRDVVGGWERGEGWGTGGGEREGLRMGER